MQAIKPPGTYPIYVTLLSLWLTLLSSAINPWLYSILNRTFRVAMHKSALHFWQKITQVHGNNNQFGFTDGETHNVRNSCSQDNAIERKSEETTPRKVGKVKLQQKVEVIKLETVRENKESCADASPKIQIPGQIVTPEH